MTDGPSKQDAYAAQSGSYKVWVTGQVSRKKKSMERSPYQCRLRQKESIGLNPTVQVSHRLLGEPSAIELAGIIASLGLRRISRPSKPLVTTGIQATYETPSTPSPSSRS